MAAFQSLVATTFRVAHFVPVREILDSGSRAYRDAIPSAGGAAAGRFREWFFAIARRFRGDPDALRGAELRALLSPVSRLEDAFLVAQTLAERADLLYWEGYAVAGALPVSVAVHHAWNTAGDTLVDATWSGGRTSGNLYLGVSVPHVLLRRLRAELAAGGKRYHGPLAFLCWASQASNGQEPPLDARRREAVPTRPGR